jgi:F-type H+-transporting ATPase subunit a
MQVAKEAIEYNIPHLPPVILMTFVAWAIVAAFSLIAARKASAVPKGLQNFAEFLFEWVFQLADRIVGPEAPRFYPLFFGIFFFVFTANVIGVIPGLISPTSNPNVPIALALTVFVYYNAQGFIRHGFGYFKHFIIPGLPLWMLPVNVLIFFIEIISQFVRPFSLSIRLFCNIFSKEALLGVLAYLTVVFFAFHGMEKAITIMPFLLRPVVILLAFLLSMVQMLIFLILSMVYIAGVVKSEH